MVTEREQREKNNMRRDKISGYFLDMSKLTFGATVLGGILPVFRNASVIDTIYVAVGLLGSVVFYNIAKKILK
ncbi:MAG: hypothetical protein PUD15_08715 [Prevotella sp.]|nr:hypothetical protein [Prevotella sp.]